MGEKIRLQVQMKDGKYPFFEDKQLDLTGIGSRKRGRVIYLSGRFVRQNGNESYVEFERINNVSLELMNAQMVKTEKETLVIKYEPNFLRNNVATFQIPLF